jgi:hypothetical protein
LNRVPTTSRTIYVAEEITVGVVESDIKVPAGVKFLVFPGLLNLVEGEQIEGEGEMEEDEEFSE